MTFSDPAPAKPKGEDWKVFAWIGGGCLVVVLGVLQLVLLLAWANSRMLAVKKLQLEKRATQAMEHPVLPAWIPVYPGTQAMGAAGKKKGEVSLHTQDVPEKVLGFYADRLRANGFAVESRTEEAQSLKLHARRGDGSELTVQSGQGHTGTWVVLTYKDGG